MDNAQVQQELTTLLRAASGFDPNTGGWTAAIDKLFERGATPTDIIARAKNALSHPYHRAKLLDDGAKYIGWKFHELNGSSAPPTHKVRTADSMKYEGYRHQRWEVDMHLTDPERKMTPDERWQWLARYMSQNAAGAYEMASCPVCANDRGRHRQ